MANTRTQFIRFDNGVTKSPNLNTTFIRNTTARKLDGSEVSPNEMRFEESTLFMNHPINKNVLVSSGSYHPQSFGYTPEGAPILSVLDFTNNKWNIHLTESAPEDFYSGIDTSTTKSIDFADIPSPNISGYQFVPKGTRIVSGSGDIPSIILAHCTVQQYIDGSGAYIPVRDGLIFTTHITGVGADVVWVSPRVTGIFTSFGDNSSISVWPMSSTEFVCITNSYGRNENTGEGNGWHQIATKFNYVSGEWVGTPVIFGSGTATGQIGLCGGIIKSGATDWRIFASVGGGKDNNALYYRRRNGNGWGATGTWTDSGISGEYSIYTLDTTVGLWGTMVAVHGGVNNASGISALHNESRNMVPANDDMTSVLCGMNGSAAPICEMSISGGTATNPIIQWRTQGGRKISSNVGDGIRTYSLNGDSSRGFVAQINGDGWGGPNNMESRIIYNNGSNNLWGQVYISYADTNSSICLYSNNKIFMGHTSSGMAYITLPSMNIINPLCLAHSNHNIMASSISVPTEGLDPSNTITKVSVVSGMVSGIAPIPPCNTDNIFYLKCENASGGLGNWSLVNDNAQFTNNFLLKSWVYHVPATSATGVYSKRNTGSVFFGLSDASGDAILDVGTMIFDSAQWIPSTIFVSSGDFAIGNTWELISRVRAYTSGSEESPQHFFLAWEGVYPDTDMISSHGINPQSSGSIEQLDIHGFNVGHVPSWSLLFVGMIPEDQWDNREGSISTKELFRAYKSNTDNYISVNANPYNSGISIITPLVSGYDINTSYWLRKSPILCLLVCNSGITTLYYSVGNSDVNTLSINDGIFIDSVQLGNCPILVDRIEYSTIPVLENNITPVFSGAILEGAIDNTLFINRYASKAQPYLKDNKLNTFVRSTNQQNIARLSHIHIANPREPDKFNTKVSDREVISSGFNAVDGTFEYIYDSGVNYEIISGSGDRSITTNSYIYKSGRGDIVDG